MEDLQDYLKGKLTELKKLYNVESNLNNYFDRHIKRQWKDDYKRTQAQWQEVKSVSDVIRYVNGFTGTVKQYQKVKGLFSDAYDMDFHTFGKKDIDSLFDELYKWIEEMHTVNTRRAMQD